MLRRSMMKNEEEEMGWKEVKTVYAENDGDVLFVDGFEAERIRITAMLGAVSDNTGIRFSISSDEYDKCCNVGTFVTTSLKPLMFELATIGEYAISTTFCPIKSVINLNASGDSRTIGISLPQGESMLKRFRINSANSQLLAGSWMKVEKWC